MNPPTAFVPLTKDDVAKILRVSVRCVENWVNDGTLLPPGKIRNRVFWHPDLFFKWLEDHLAPRNQATDVSGESVAEDRAGQKAPRPHARIDAGKRDLVQLRSKSLKLVAKLEAD